MTVSDLENDEQDFDYQIKVANASINILFDCKLSASLSALESTCLIETKSFGKLQVLCHNTNLLQRDQQDHIYNIFEQNVGTYYEESSWGLKPIEKKNEMFHPLSRILYVLHDGLIAGYITFRFEYDDEEEPEYNVTYCYELQISKFYQNQGIGKSLMNILRTISSNFKMWKIMLTCFKANTNAISFYENIGYKIDSNSPSKFGMNECYEIYSLKI